MKKTILSMAVISAALIIGCGGPKKVNDGFEQVTTPTQILREKCNTKYKDYYCGIGDEVSSQEGTATTFAETRARANMSTSIATLVKRVAGISTSNTSDKDDVSGAVERIGEESKNELVDMTVQETMVRYKKKKKKYHVHVMVTTNKKDFLDKLKARISANQELAALAKTAQIMEAINKEIESTENFLER
jgi:hypothetical protein